MLVNPLYVCGSSFAAALVVVSLVRSQFLRGRLMDIPNHRSSHAIATPRGGGLGILVPVVIWLVLGAVQSPALWSVGASAGVVAVAAIGFLDDLYGLTVYIRLVIHITAACVLAVTAVSLLQQPNATTLWLVGVTVWWVFWGVSLTNVVNFMDGIDTLVGLQALIFAVFTYVAVGGGGVALVSSAIVGAGAGFLVFNRPPAKVFLGDVGSGSLGLLFGFMGLGVMAYGGLSLLHAFLPLMAMFADELLTAARRIRKGERLSEAHCSHVYQELVSRGWGHGPVALGYAAHAAISAGIALLLPALDVRFLFFAGILLVSTLFGMSTVSRRSGLMSEVQRVRIDGQ